VRRPRDRAKVEAGVLLVERWILASLRHQRFFSLAELNAANRGARPMRKLGISRRLAVESLGRSFSPIGREAVVI
jgi:hypothetical protein